MNHTLNTASQYLQIFCLIGDTSDAVSEDSLVKILKLLSDEKEGLSVSFKSISILNNSRPEFLAIEKLAELK